jgi:DNA-binding GntR family transcriptional regulator
VDRHFARPSERLGDCGDSAAAVVRAHERILEALLDRDLPVARRRMHRHLQALDAWWR